MPEKRYALTQHSAQTLFRQQRQARGGGAAAGSAGSAGLISGDRWQRTGGYNPGVILLAFPSTKVHILLALRVQEFEFSGSALAATTQTSTHLNLLALLVQSTSTDRAAASLYLRPPVGALSAEGRLGCGCTHSHAAQSSCHGWYVGTSRRLLY